MFPFAIRNYYQILKIIFSHGVRLFRTFLGEKVCEPPNYNPINWFKNVDSLISFNYYNELTVSTALFINLLLQLTKPDLSTTWAIVRSRPFFSNFIGEICCELFSPMSFMSHSSSLIVYRCKNVSSNDGNSEVKIINDNFYTYIIIFYLFSLTVLTKIHSEVT